ncbi:MAG: IclR family transcriptional regulator [Granulosicoccus sp.]
MSSTVKTFELLGFFSQLRPEIGLSELCRLAKRDKATTHRHLQYLEEVGLVEQNIVTREYRLGPAILQLAQTREVTVPRKLGAQRALKKLVDATGETAHVSVLSRSTLYTLAFHESTKHSIRVVIDVPTLPLHATASGLSVLAFGDSDLMSMAAKKLKPFTKQTAITRRKLEKAVNDARASGFGRANRTFEDEVYSLAVPLFDQTGKVAGALSVASVASRLSEQADLEIRQQLMKAGREISRNWGGSISESVETCWAKALANADT